MYQLMNNSEEKSHQTMQGGDTTRPGLRNSVLWEDAEPFDAWIEKRRVLNGIPVEKDDKQSQV